MKRNISILLLYIGVALLSIMVGITLLVPAVVWNNIPADSLSIFIVDNIPSTEQDKGDDGLMWVLNHHKVIGENTKDSLRYNILDMPDLKEKPDLIYLTDTYGVPTDGNNITNNLGGGNTFIAEFSTASASTSTRNQELDLVFGVQSSGWKGRYFKDLTPSTRIPVQIIENYEVKEKKSWEFKGSGYILISENDQIVVLEEGKHVGAKGLTINFEEEYRLEFGVDKEIPYHYWFELLEVVQGTESIANYYLDATSEGKSILTDLGLSSIFPAITRKTNSQYTSYYFTGNYSDLEGISKPWNYSGVEKIKKVTSSINTQSPDFFYWNAYVPMMTQIITDVGENKKPNNLVENKEKPPVAKIEGKDFYIYADGKWEKKFLKGVNMGAAKPGTFPGDLAITKEDYLRWFKSISEMNAEVIRVYTTLSPDFYDALYIYNKTVSKPLYLIQGVWVKEEDTAELGDVYKDNERIINSLIKDSSDLVDIFHGNATLPKKQGFACGEYRSDVSEYVIGWIFGIEWDPKFVEGTDKNNPQKGAYEGKYLYTHNASPFEAFLCKAGDKIIEYEQDHYNAERPISFSNWPTTDMLSHPNEPFPDEDFASVNVEHIKTRETFQSGMFASYHIYPYYPEFMNYDKKYATFKDSDGQINTYKAYLRDLMKEHTMPVLVAEFGIPASRGNTHVNVHMGYDQGHKDEMEQGAIIESLLQDIYDEGYCGGLVFTWQDEWFKRAWNTMDFDIPTRRAFWSNPQTSEQEFGLLAFEPGTQSICHVDGDIGEWAGETPVHTSDDVSLYIKSDEKYLYLMADTKDFDFDKDQLIIPVDTIDEQGNNKDNATNVNFSRAADFVILIDGKDNSEIFVDTYYDSFQYMYAHNLGLLETNPFYNQKDSGAFSPMYLCISMGGVLPEDQAILPVVMDETGLLKYGNSNPDHKDFNSLTDFCEKEGKVEMRIPWQLLNVMDPSTKSIMKDFHKAKKFFPQKVDGFYFGAGILKDTQPSQTINMDFYSWDPWEEVTFHERLKPSYYILQAAFERIQAK